MMGPCFVVVVVVNARVVTVVVARVVVVAGAISHRAPSFVCICVRYSSFVPKFHKILNSS